MRPVTPGVPRPRKNPWRTARRVSILGDAALFARDASPASTFLMLRAELRLAPTAIACCVLTRFCRVRCWAKPNHGFFQCQQPCANFLRAGLHRARMRATRTLRNGNARCHLASMRVRQARRCARALARFAGMRARTTGRLASAARSRDRATRIAPFAPIVRLASPQPRARVCASHKPVCAKTARAARPSIAWFRPVRHRDRGSRAKKNPRRFHRGLHARPGRALLSDRRPRAIPRIRPGPAVR